MSCCVVRYVVPDVSENHNAFIARVKQSSLTMTVKAQQSFEMSADTHPKDTVSYPRRLASSKTQPREPQISYRSRSNCQDVESDILQAKNCAQHNVSIIDIDVAANVKIAMSLTNC
jgi:hypothetical protein